MLDHQPSPIVPASEIAIKAFCPGHYHMSSHGTTCRHRLLTTSLSFPNALLILCFLVFGSWRRFHGRQYLNVTMESADQGLLATIDVDRGATWLEGGLRVNVDRERACW